MAKKLGKKCRKGKPCGKTCISRGRTCSKTSSDTTGAQLDRLTGEIAPQPEAETLAGLKTELEEFKAAQKKKRSESQEPTPAPSTDRETGEGNFETPDRLKTQAFVDKFVNEDFESVFDLGVRATNKIAPKAKGRSKGNTFEFNSSANDAGEMLESDANSSESVDYDALDKISSEANGYMVDLNFSVNDGIGDNVDTVTGFSDKQRDRLWNKFSSKLQDGTIVTNRERTGTDFYSSKGLSNTKENGTQYGIVRNGQIEPLNFLKDKS